MLVNKFIEVFDFSKTRTLVNIKLRDNFIILNCISGMRYVQYLPPPLNVNKIVIFGIFDGRIDF
jgi:hypothetical protein